MRSISLLLVAAAFGSATLPAVAFAMDTPPTSGSPGGSSGGKSPSGGSGSPTAVPEPATVAMLASGIVGLAVARRMRRKRKD